MTKYKGGTLANVNIGGSIYTNCFYDELNDEWVSPSQGRLYPDEERYTVKIEVISVPQAPAPDEPKGLYAVVRAARPRDGEKYTYVRTEKNKGYPWERIGSTSGAGEFSWLYFSPYNQVEVIWSGQDS